MQYEKDFSLFVISENRKAKSVSCECVKGYICTKQKVMSESGKIKTQKVSVKSAVARTSTRRLNKAEHLVNKGIESAFAKHPLYSQDGKGGDADILVKYFNPYGRGTWYVLEANKLPDNDYELYGIVDMGYGQEYGYFRLSELQNYTYKMGNYVVGGIERDMYFGKKKVKDIKND